ncbi:hypothetical protein SEA_SCOOBYDOOBYDOO_243 [Mycobacterium phage ScoobyDoobyDoo]|nr:hypothetical protein SEA_SCOOBYDOOBYDOO_243 [Mycobacterium phage ScoobyDoobyDoo]
MAGKHASAIDAEAMTVTMAGDPLEETQVQKTRRVIAAQALREHPDDPEAAAVAARELMMMLGIHPDQENDEHPRLGPNNLPNPEARR